MEKYILISIFKKIGSQECEVPHVTRARDSEDAVAYIDGLLESIREAAELKSGDNLILSARWREISEEVYATFQREWFHADGWQDGGMAVTNHGVGFEVVGIRHMAQQIETKDSRDVLVKATMVVECNIAIEGERRNYKLLVNCDNKEQDGELSVTVAWDGVGDWMKEHGLNADAAQVLATVIGMAEKEVMRLAEKEGWFFV